MPKNDDKSVNKNRPKQETREQLRVSKSGIMILTEKARIDVRSVVDGDWLKKSRDDVPPNDRPIPTNPLLELKPHSPDEQSSDDDTNDTKPDGED